MSFKARILSNRGATPQWGKGRLFELDGYKSKLNKKGVKLSLIAFTLCFSLFALLQDGHEEHVYSSEISEAKADGDVRQVIQAAPPGISSEFGSGVESSKSPKRKTGKKTESLFIGLGPQIIQPKNSPDVPTGTFIKARLLTGGTNGLIKAQILESIFNGNDLLAPELSTILGQGSSSDDRLTVKFDKLILTDGSKVKINAQAYDLEDQILGLKGTTKSDKALKIAGGVALGFLGGMSEGLQDSQNVNGLEVREPSMRNAMLNGAATASINESKDLLQNLKDQKPVIQVPAQKEFYLLLDEESHDVK